MSGASGFIATSREGRLAAPNARGLTKHKFLRVHYIAVHNGNDSGMKAFLGLCHVLPPVDSLPLLA